MTDADRSPSGLTDADRGTGADPALRSATIEQIFADAGALLDGHFLLKSGRHAGRYLEKFRVLQHPRLAAEIGRRFAEALAPHRPTLVVGPTTGGVLLAHEAARHLEPMLGLPVRGIFAEPVPGGGRALRRGWPIGSDERVVLVDDILTTGASLIETADAVRAAGADPLAAAVIVDRSTGAIGLHLAIHALGRVEVPSWEPQSCELCSAGVPLRKPGSS